MRLALAGVAFLCLCASAPNALAHGGCSGAIGEALYKEPLVKYEKGNWKYQGLTPKGLETLKTLRDTLRERARLFEADLLNLTTARHAAEVARMTKGNMYLYGPPGGAKSMLANWMLNAEKEPAFRLQLHQMISEMPFVGGQDFDVAKKGVYAVETKKSLADHVTGLLDEAEKGNPAALATLLSLLNERKILAGSQEVKARLETLFATSNANLPEVLQFFVESGQGTTGPAYISRWQFKAMFYNWLTLEQQAKIDQRRERKEYLQSVARTHPEVLKDEVFLEPGKLEWQTLRDLSQAMVELSPLLMTTFRQVVNDVRKATNVAIRESEEAHKANHLEEPFIYFPSADLNERLRGQIPEVIRTSAFLDFLLSPMADDANLAHLAQNRIVLDALSLWRSYLILTTVGPGHTRLEFQPEEKSLVKINWDWSIDPSSARDSREQKLIENLRKEQERFAQIFTKYSASIQEEIEVRARHRAKKPVKATKKKGDKADKTDDGGKASSKSDLSLDDILLIEDPSFEILLLKANQN